MIITRANSGDEWIDDLLVAFDKAAADEQHAAMLEEFDFERHPFAEVCNPVRFDVEAHREDYDIFPDSDMDELMTGGYVVLNDQEKRELESPTPQPWKMGGAYLVSKKRGYHILVTEGYGGQGYTTSTI